MESLSVTSIDSAFTQLLAIKLSKLYHSRVEEQADGSSSP